MDEESEKDECIGVDTKPDPLRVGQGSIREWGASWTDT